jgi:hypothetical protein
MKVLFRILVLPVLLVLALLGMLAYLVVLAIEPLQAISENPTETPLSHIEDFANANHALRGGQ